MHDPTLTFEDVPETAAADLVADPIDPPNARFAFILLHGWWLSIFLFSFLENKLEEWGRRSQFLLFAQSE